ncbi:hypothetical protein EDD86DRAFT_211684, partial [Gorgonomyces haynaldii]
MAQVFDMIWSVVDDQHMVNELVSQLDLAQVHALLVRIHDLMLDQKGVQFALYLNFKKQVISVIVQRFTLQQLSQNLPLLHPMECIYMLLNSSFCLQEDLDTFEGFFGAYPDTAFTVFLYIVRWINWKIVDVDQIDQRFYEAYFHDYSREERKRVVNLMGLDFLRFIQKHPQQQKSLLSSLQEIVPLLDMDHLLMLDDFFQNEHLDPVQIYVHLSAKHIITVFGFFHSSSPSPTVLTPLFRPFAINLIHFIGSLYLQSIEMGDTYLQQCHHLLVQDLIDEIPETKPQTYPPLVLLCLFTSPMVMHRILESVYLQPVLLKAKKTLVFYSVIDETCDKTSLESLLQVQGLKHELLVWASTSTSPLALQLHPILTSKTRDSSVMHSAPSLDDFFAKRLHTD